MKLNIEELSKQAGIETKLWNMGAASLVYTEGCHGVARSEFEAFARLIVERCAQECEAVSLQAVTAWKLAYQPVDQGREIGADECESAIRQLLED